MRLLTIPQIYRFSLPLTLNSNLNCNFDVKAALYIRPYMQYLLKTGVGVIFVQIMKIFIDGDTAVMIS